MRAYEFIVERNEQQTVKILGDLSRVITDPAATAGEKANAKRLLAKLENERVAKMTGSDRSFIDDLPDYSKHIVINPDRKFAHDDLDDFGSPIDKKRPVGNWERGQNFSKSV